MRQLCGPKPGMAACKVLAVPRSGSHCNRDTALAVLVTTAVTSPHVPVCKDPLWRSSGRTDISWR